MHEQMSSCAGLMDAHITHVPDIFTPLLAKADLASAGHSKEQKEYVAEA